MVKLTVITLVVLKFYTESERTTLDVCHHTYCAISLYSCHIHPVIIGKEPCSRMNNACDSILTKVDMVFLRILKGMSEEERAAPVCRNEYSNTFLSQITIDDIFI